jgi:CRP-like cAMP-binding protein
MTYTQPDLLRDLSPEESDQALALGLRMTVSSGAKLFELGDAADRIFIIQRGRIRLTLPMQVRGREEDIIVEERSPGQTVGWSALIPPYRFTLTAVAPLETEVIALSRESLSTYFEAHPDVAYIVSMNLASVIGHRLQIFQAMWLREMQRTVELHSA